MKKMTKINLRIAELRSGLDKFKFTNLLIAELRCGLHYMKLGQRRR